MNSRKGQYSDEQAYQQIRDEIEKLYQQQNLKKLDRQHKIFNLYVQKKNELRIRKLKDSNKNQKYKQEKVKKLSSDEEGQVSNQELNINNKSNIIQGTDNVLSINTLGDLIRPLTLPRSRVLDLLNSRRFQQLVKGCFIRYVNNNQKSTIYQIAQIVGVTQSQKQYLIQGNIKTRVLLKLQQTSDSVVSLNLNQVSNKHPPGGLQIQKWLQTNNNKVPKQHELKQKLQQHKKLLAQHLSSKQIDSNIWKKAKRIAQSTTDPKEDVFALIDFVNEKYHDIQIKIEEAEIEKLNEKDKNTQAQNQKQIKLSKTIENLQKQKSEIDDVLTKLKRIREKYGKKKPDKKIDTKKQKIAQYEKTEDKREDKIQQKCKNRFVMLASYEGCVRLKKMIIDNHTTYDHYLDDN